MDRPDASRAGTFEVGGQDPVHRLAFGAMRLTGGMAGREGPVARIARAHGATPSQVALAWFLARSPVILPIPGTSRVDHLEENVAAAGLSLTEEEMEVLEGAPVG